MAGGGAKYQRVPFNPFIYPSIPEEEQEKSPNDKELNLQRLASLTLIWLCFCLSCNVVATQVLRAILGQGTACVVFSIATSLVVYTLAYTTWYSSLSHALSMDSAASFRRFFIFFFVHIGFCVFAVVSPPTPPEHGRSFTGIVSAINVYSVDGVVGIFYFVVFGFFCFELCLSLYLLQRVNLYYRSSSGLDLEMVV